MNVWKLKTTAILCAASALSAGVALAADSIPSLIRVVLPGELAARIAQDALGVSSPEGGSRVTIPVKKPIEVKVKVNLSRAPEGVKFYGSKLFGINFETPFHLDIRINELVVKGDVVVKKITFTEPPRSDNRVFVDVELELRRIKAVAKDALIRELGLSPKENAPASEGCKVLMSKLLTFSKERIGARFIGAGIVPVSDAKGNQPVTVKARYEAHYVGKKLELRPDSVRHNVVSILSPGYKLIGELEVPPVIHKSGKNCYPGDDSGVKAFFDGRRDSIKEIILKGTAKEIIKLALKESERAIAKLNIPVEKDFQKAAAFPVLTPIVSVQDHTAVANSARMVRADETKIVPNKKSSVIDEILWNIQEKIALGAISAGKSGSLNLELGDQLTLNKNTEASVQPTEEGTFPPQLRNHLRVVLNSNFFRSKVNLLESLRVEREALLPSGVRLGEKAIELLPLPGNRLSLVAHLEVNLENLPGVIGTAASLVESATGDTGGTYRLPLRFDLKPEIVSGSEPSRELKLGLSLHHELNSVEFQQSSNLEKASPVIRWFISKKLKEIASKLAENAPRIKLAPIEEKSPFRVERVVFSDRGSLALDLSIQKSLIRTKPSKVSP